MCITAAHCLPFIPTPHPGRTLDECTYANLLGPLDGECMVWAECVFVDAIADIAVLGRPDNQDLSDQADAYNQLMERTPALPLADAPPEVVKVLVQPDGERIEYPAPGPGHAWVLQLTGKWSRIPVRRRRGWLGTERQFTSGMSGSPIIDAGGAAIGIVSTEMMCPVIVDTLSAQLVRNIMARGDR